MELIISFIIVAAIIYLFRAEYLVYSEDSEESETSLDKNGYNKENGPQEYLKNENQINDLQQHRNVDKLTYKLLKVFINSCNRSANNTKIVRFSNKNIQLRFSTESHRNELIVYKNMSKLDENKRILKIDIGDSYNFYTDDELVTYAILTTENLKLLTPAIVQSLKIEINENRLIMYSRNKNFYLRKDFYEMLLVFLERFLNSDFSSNLLIANILNEPSMKIRIANLLCLFRKSNFLTKLKGIKRIKERFPETLFIIEHELNNHGLADFYDIRSDNEYNLLTASDCELLMRQFNNEKLSKLIHFLDCFDPYHIINQFILKECQLEKKSSSQLLQQLINKGNFLLFNFPLNESTKDALVNYFGKYRIAESSHWLSSLIDFENVSISDRVLEALINIGDGKTVKLLKQLLEEYKEKNILVKNRNQVRRKMQIVIKQIEKEIRNTSGGLSIVEADKSGSLSITKDDQSGSLSMPESQ